MGRGLLLGFPVPGRLLLFGFLPLFFQQDLLQRPELVQRHVELHQRGALFGQPFLLLLVQPGGQEVVDLGVVVVDPVPLGDGHLVPDDRVQVDGHEGQRLEGQPAAVLVGAGVHAFQLVFDPDAHLVGLIDAGLVGDGHARLEDHLVVGPQALGAFVYAGDIPHAVAGAAAVVDLVGPQRPPGEGVQRKAGGVVQEFGPGHLDVGLQHPGVELPVFVRHVDRRLQRVGAGDVGGAAVILAAGVHQQHPFAADLGVGAALHGVIVHHGGVGAPGRDGLEAVLQVAGLFPPAGLEHLLDVGLVEGAALGQRFFQVHLEPDHGHAVPDVAFPQVFKLHRVLDPLEGGDRVPAFHHLQAGVGGQGGVKGVVGGALVHQHRLVGQGLHIGQELLIPPQGDPLPGQGFGVGFGQTPRCDKEGAVPLGHKAEGHGQRGAGQVPGPQVQQPAQAVQRRHGQGGGAGLVQFGAQGGEFFGGGGAGLLDTEQEAGGVGQGGAVLPQRAHQVPLGQGGAGLFQRGPVLFHRGGGGAAAVQQQGLAGGEVRGQVLLHRGHAGGPGVHAGDLGAGQLLVPLDVEPAVHPQGAAGQGDHQGGVFAGEAGEPGQGVVVVGQVFVVVGVAGHDQHPVAAGVPGGLPQRGDLFVDSHGCRLLLFCGQGRPGACHCSTLLL